MAMRSLSCLVTVVLLLSGFGCGGDRPVRVNGIVTLDGNPVENAMVTFFPEGQGRHAHARTGPDGSFRLSTFDPNDGAMRGTYKVTVQYEEGIEVPPANNMKDAFAAYEKAKQQKKKPPKYVIPARYSELGKTVLKQQVPPNGTVVLALESK